MASGFACSKSSFVPGKRTLVGNVTHSLGSSTAFAFWAGAHCRTQSLRSRLKPCGGSLELSRGCQVGETLPCQSDCHSSYPLKLLAISCSAVLTEGLLDFNRLKCMRSWWIGKSGFAVIFLNSRTRICFLRTLGGSMWGSTGSHSISVDRYSHCLAQNSVDFTDVGAVYPSWCAVFGRWKNKTKCRSTQGWSIKNNDKI